MRNSSLRHEHRRAYVDGKQRVEVVDLEICNGVISRDRGIVDQNVEVPQRADSVVDGSLYGIRIGAIGLDRN